MLGRLKGKETMKIKRIISVFILLASLTLVACSSGMGPIKGNGDEQKVFMTVDGVDVYYEEIRYLAVNYIKGATEEELGSADLEERLTDFVMRSARKNAVLSSLCREYGIAPEKDDVADAVQKKIDSMAEEAGGKDAYLSELQENGMTDHCLRYYFALEEMRSLLEAELYKDGTIKADDETALEYIKGDNFIRTWHVYIGNDDGDDIEANYDTAKDVLAQLRDGAAMKSMIGRYSEDYTLTTLDGVYFTRGEFDMEYENAAFALGVGEISEVVEATSGFYIIQRLEKEDAYIEKNFESLKMRYLYVMLDNMLDSLAEEADTSVTDFGSRIKLTEIK